MTTLRLEKESEWIDRGDFKEKVVLQFETDLPGYVPMYVTHILQHENASGREHKYWGHYNLTKKQSEVDFDSRVALLGK